MPCAQRRWRRREPRRRDRCGRWEGKFARGLHGLRRQERESAGGGFESCPVRQEQTAIRATPPASMPMNHRKSAIPARRGSGARSRKTSPCNGSSRVDVEGPDYRPACVNRNTADATSSYGSAALMFLSGFIIPRAGHGGLPLAPNSQAASVPRMGSDGQIARLSRIVLVGYKPIETTSFHAACSRSHGRSSPSALEAHRVLWRQAKRCRDAWSMARHGTRQTGKPSLCECETNCPVFPCQGGNLLGPVQNAQSA